MDIILIAAMASNRIIGKDNQLPWHIPEELKLFKKTTMGYPMIMGRKTFDALPGMLPGRRHIVLSRNQDFAAAGAEAAGSLQEALELCQGNDKVFIIGGAQIFELSLPVASHIYLTVLEKEVVGDVSFPLIPAAFQLSHEEAYPEASTPFTVQYFERHG